MDCRVKPGNDDGWVRSVEWAKARLRAVPTRVFAGKTIYAWARFALPTLLA